MILNRPFQIKLKAEFHDDLLLLGRQYQSILQPDELFLHAKGTGSRCHKFGPSRMDAPIENHSKPLLLSYKIRRSNPVEPTLLAEFYQRSCHYDSMRYYSSCHFL
jgi:hypothetical protein